MAVAIFFVVVFILAYSNGANDNFKGVATLFGSGTSNYKTAIWWGTATTFLGSVCSIYFAQTLVKNFSGKGLVPAAVAASPEFILAVAMGAGLTVLFAAFAGFPISTTHSLVGALVGSGFMAIGSGVNFSMLGSIFFLPLLLSPLVAVLLSALAYIAFRALRISLGVTKESCICIAEAEPALAVSTSETILAARPFAALDAIFDKEEDCAQHYTGKIIGINCQKALDTAHYISAGLVSFARGLNDTPKIVALLLAIKAFELQWGMLAVAGGMAVGGLLNAKRVAETISKKITAMNHGQGFTANIVTGILVIFASRLGMPVSTTHVSVGSLFGLGLVTREVNTKVMRGILSAWVLTLPIAALIGALTYWLI